MFKKILAFLAAMSVFAAFAAVELNKATEAELDGLKGIGPVTSRLIISERKKGDFKSWDDFITRVKGVGENSATKFSAAGLTVNGARYQGSSGTPAKGNGKTDTEKTGKSIPEKAKEAAMTTKDAAKDLAGKTRDAVKETAKDVKAAMTPKSDTTLKTPKDDKVDGARPAATAASSAKR